MSDREREIEGRVSAATEGPWQESATEVWAEGDTVLFSADHYDATGVDLAFIAHARADVPWLLAELREARERAETLEAFLSANEIELNSTRTDLAIVQAALAEVPRG